MCTCELRACATFWVGVQRSAVGHTFRHAQTSNTLTGVRAAPGAKQQREARDLLQPEQRLRQQRDTL